jgi:hypothetical protein
MSVDILKKLFDGLSPEDKQEIAKQLLGEESSPSKTPAKTERTVYKPKARKVVVNEDFSVTSNEERRGNKTPVKAKQNQWTDQGEGRDETFDPDKYEEVGRAPRSRQSPDIVEVECHVCKRTFSANSNTLYGTFHRCGRCTGR